MSFRSVLVISNSLKLWRVDGWVVPWTVTGVLVVALLVVLINKVSTFFLHQT